MMFHRESLWTPTSRLWLVMTMAAVLAGTAVVYVGHPLWSEATIPPVRLEVLKSALQVLVVALVGNLLTFLVQAVQKQHVLKASERELRINVLRRAVKNYAAAKKIRRQLRTGTDVRSLFDMLNDIQLEFESMKKEVKHAPMFSEATAIAAAFGSIEKYLHKLIKECERAPTDKTLRFPFSAEHLESLADFTGPYKGSCFQAQFAYAFDVLLALMQAAILDNPGMLPSPGSPVSNQPACKTGWFNPKLRPKDD